MVKKLFKCILCGICFEVCLLSCASKPEFSGNGDLCGLVVDENNKPISDFVITCWKNPGEENVTSTNENGVFVFPNVPSGKYFISGRKNGWATVNKAEYWFDSRSKLFCLKVNSMVAALDAAEKQIKCGNFDKAMKLLEEIAYEKNSIEESMILLYEAYVEVLKGDGKSAAKKVKIVEKKKKLDCPDEIKDKVEVKNEK